MPRASHGTWTPPPDRPDPVALLQEQAADRVPELVPIRYGRMAASPFGYLRGAAYVMAADLSRTPTSGITVQLCGDAHLANFGGFASPERQLVFDINDFDETLPGPWEYDVKRLLVSLEVAGRERGFSAPQRRAIVLAAARQYRTAMADFAAMGRLDVWYARLGERDIRTRFGTLVGRSQAKAFDKATAAARRRDSVLALQKLTRQVNGTTRLTSRPPLLVPISELIPAGGRESLQRSIAKLIGEYRKSLPVDRRSLLSSYEFADLAHKVVGVGSVGTLCWVALLRGETVQDPLFLQIKEATASVHERFLRPSSYKNHGQRVVEGQRLIQPTSDILLGWLRADDPMRSGAARDFYVRQLWDWKLSADITSFNSRNLSTYGAACAWVLARAHARSGDRAAIAGYLGSSDVFDVAVASFASAYADQNERDHHALVAAVGSGRVTAREG